MGLSMRRQTNKRKKNDKILAKRREGRTEALRLLQTTTYSLREISDRTNVTKSTIGQLKQLLRKQDDKGIKKVLEAGRVGVGTVLTDEEESMIVQRILFCASRGFAINQDLIKRVMARIAADGRRGWRNGITSDDAVRTFRARHREITYKKVENKEGAKLRAENREHVQTLFTAMEEVNRLHPGLLTDPDRIWNVDETAVDATEMESQKAYCSSQGHHGGYTATTSVNGPSKHITAAVAVSASGRKTPPFFIVVGQRVMCNWISPLSNSREEKKDRREHSICDKYFREGWFPKDGVIKMSENGSMEIELLPSLMKHIDKAVRAVLPPETSYLLTLDGHSSRNGIEWIEVCKSNNCEVIVSPASTSHFLQPCDQDVNSRFKSSLKELSTVFARDTNLDTRKVGVNLACGVHAFQSITAADISRAFSSTGIYPFDSNFPDRFRPGVPHTTLLAETQRARLENASIASRFPSVRKRNSDKHTYNEAVKILEQSQGPSQALQRLSMLLKSTETVNDILMGSDSKVSENNGKTVRAAKDFLDGGAPAECVTLAEMLENRRKKEAEALLQRQQKEQEKLRKQQETVARIEEQQRKRAERAVEQCRRMMERNEAALLKQQEKSLRKADRERAKRVKRSQLEREKERKATERAQKKEMLARAKEASAKTKAEIRELVRIAKKQYGTSSDCGTKAVGRGTKRSRDSSRQSVPTVTAFTAAATIMNQVMGSVFAMAQVDQN